MLEYLKSFFTVDAELLNGRVAMLAVVILLLEKLV